MEDNSESDIITNRIAELVCRFFSKRNSKTKYILEYRFSNIYSFIIIFVEDSDDNKSIEKDVNYIFSFPNKEGYLSMVLTTDQYDRLLEGDNVLQKQVGFDITKCKVHNRKDYLYFL